MFIIVSCGCLRFSEPPRVQVTIRPVVFCIVTQNHWITATPMKIPFWNTLRAVVNLWKHRKTIPNNGDTISGTVEPANRPQPRPGWSLRQQPRISKTQCKNPLRIGVMLFVLLYVWPRHFLVRRQFLMFLGALESRVPGLFNESKNIKNDWWEVFFRTRRKKVLI